MRIPLRPGRVESQVRMILVLLALFFAAAGVVQLVLLGRARASLDRSERQRVQSQAARVVGEIGSDALRDGIEARDGSGETPMSPTALRRAATRLGLDRIALLDRAGREVVASGAIGARPHGAFLDLGSDERAALAAGRPATVETDRSRRGAEARMTAYVPILDPSGKLVGIVEATAPVPDLGALQTRLASLVALQGGGALLIGGLLLFYARRSRRPLRALASSAAEAGRPSDGRGAEAEPAELVSAFRAIVAKLKEQDAAVEALEREGSGLGVLVRFASNAALRLPTGVLVVDRHSRVAAMNASAAVIFDCADGEARGRPLAEIPRVTDGLVRLVRGCIDQAQGVSREVLEIRRDDGRPGYLGVGVTPAFGAGGEVAGVLVLMSDLTEIRQLQEQAHLRENLAAVGQLSAGIAHEFRNALGTILGYAKILQKHADPRARGPVLEILKEIGSVRGVVDDFLLYARPPDPDRRALDLGGLVRRIAAVAPDRVEVEVRGEFGTVLGDEALLRRAFGNLVQNASDAGAECGRKLRMTIVGRRHPSGRSLQIEVEDDGPGIPPDLRDKVFVPFYTTRVKGTGLGLALVQRTLVDLGGSVEVTEGSRGGALFRIRLPLVPAEADRGPAGAAHGTDASPRVPAGIAE
jgi:signal transduction histidine kinase